MAASLPSRLDRRARDASPAGLASNVDSPSMVQQCWLASSPGAALILERCRRLIEPATTRRCRNQVVATSTRARSGTRRATGGYAHHQPPRSTPPMRARTPALPGGTGAFPDCATKGDECLVFDAKLVPDVGSPLGDPVTLACSIAWRCARPPALLQAHRASDDQTLPKPSSRNLDEGAIRNPQGDGKPCPSPASAQHAPDAGEDARAPRGRPAHSQTVRPRATNALSLTPNWYQT
jgi:hypothetical protein